MLGQAQGSVVTVIHDGLEKGRCWQVGQRSSRNTSWVGQIPGRRVFQARDQVPVCARQAGQYPNVGAGTRPVS